MSAFLSSKPKMMEKHRKQDRFSSKSKQKQKSTGTGQDTSWELGRNTHRLQVKCPVSERLWYISTSVSFSLPPRGGPFPSELSQWRLGTWHWGGKQGKVLPGTAGVCLDPSHHSKGRGLLWLPQRVFTRRMDGWNASQQPQQNGGIKCVISCLVAAFRDTVSK